MPAAAPAEEVLTHKHLLMLVDLMYNWIDL